MPPLRYVQKLPATNVMILSATFLAYLLMRPVLGALVGYGIFSYKPPCAHACDRSLSSLTLQCSSDIASSSDMNSDADLTSPQCQAGNTPWLIMLSWCMGTKCANHNISTSELEVFWEEQCTRVPPVAPKWGYSKTLSNIAQPPTRELQEADSPLYSSALVNQAVYEA